MKKEAIKKEWHVPEKYHAQVQEKPETFYNVPHEYRSPQLCLEAVRGWGYNLGIVPEEMKTREMCREAFNANPDLDYGHCAIIGFMPFADVVLECLKDSAGGTDMTDLAATVRPEVMDREIAGFLVGRDGYCLQYVPVHLQTEELALMAVRTSGNAALLHRSVREDIKTEKVYMAGMEEDCFQSFLHIPPDRRTPEICLVAEKLYPDVVRARPDSIPEAVRNGCNIYTLGNLLEKACGERFDAGTVKRVYEGKPLRVKQFTTPTGVMNDTVIRFSKENSRFQYDQPHKNRMIKRGMKP